jgi:hypothetical protein
MTNSTIKKMRSKKTRKNNQRGGVKPSIRRMFGMKSKKDKIAIPESATMCDHITEAYYSINDILNKNQYDEERDAVFFQKAKYILQYLDKLFKTNDKIKHLIKLPIEVGISYYEGSFTPNESGVDGIWYNEKTGERESEFETVDTFLKKNPMYGSTIGNEVDPVTNALYEKYSGPAAVRTTIPPRASRA